MTSAGGAGCQELIAGRARARAQYQHRQPRHGSLSTLNLAIPDVHLDSHRHPSSNLDPVRARDCRRLSAAEPAVWRLASVRHPYRKAFDSGSLDPRIFGAILKQGTGSRA